MKTGWKYLKSGSRNVDVANMRRAKWKRAGWPKEKPNLTRADGEAVLKAAKNARDRLVLRLVMEAGLKTGQIVGNQSHGANIPPLRIRDLADDFVVVRIMGLRRELPVNPELIKRLREFHDPTKGEQIFQLSPGGTRSLIKTAVKNAKIRNAAIVTPDSLRGLLKPEGTRFQLQLRELFADDVGDAEQMAQYYVANYCLENSIRRLIRETLSKHGTDWWEQKVPKGIKDYVKMRQDEEGETAMSKRSSDPLDYSTFGHLRNMIDANWKDFEPKIRNQEVMGDILSELDDLRAIIAHSGKLSDREKGRLDVRVQDWQAQLL